MISKMKKIKEGIAFLNPLKKPLTVDTTNKTIPIIPTLIVISLTKNARPLAINAVIKTWMISPIGFVEVLVG